MKKQLFISLILVSSVLKMNAQIYGTLVTQTGTNRVGIGTQSPTSALDVNGTISVSQQGMGTFYNPFETEALRSNVGDANAYPSINFVNDWQNSHRSWMNFNIRDENHNKITALTISGYGRIGVRCANPTSALDVNGTISVSQQGMGTINNPFETEALRSNVGDANAYPSINFVNDWQNSHRSWMNFNVRDENHNKITALTIDGYGKVGIRVKSPSYDLDVNGTIRAKEIKVELNGADFVFEKDYKLMSLNELEQFVKEQKHLPEIAPAKEMEQEGSNLGNLSSKLLQKIEELTLYTIEQNKKIIELENQAKAIEELKQLVKLQSDKIAKLEAASK